MHSFEVGIEFLLFDLRCELHTVVGDRQLPQLNFIVGCRQPT